VANILRIKLNDQENDLDFSRFEAFEKNYKTQRGFLKEDNGRILSAQTLFPINDTAYPRQPLLDIKKDFRWAKKLAKRLSYQTYFEHQLGVGSETIDDASWSKVQVLPTRHKKWDLPILKSDKDEERSRTDSTGESNEEGEQVTNKEAGFG
jgi:hypothetical protein